MKKKVIAVIGTALITTWVACSLSVEAPSKDASQTVGETADLEIAISNAAEAPLSEVHDSPPPNVTNTPSPAASATPTPTAQVEVIAASEEPSVPVEPGIPVILDKLYLGAPAGNG